MRSETIAGGGRPARDAGFTLVELLVATALLSLLTLLLFGGLRLGTRAWEQANSAESSANRILAVQHALAEQIASAYPLYVRTSPQSGHVQFEGSSSRMRFLAPALAGGMEWVTIGAVQQDDHFNLAQWQRPELSIVQDAGSYAKLLGGIDGLQISYFGAANPRDAPRWSDSWNNAIAPPMLVRIRARMADHHVAWPELVVGIHAAVDQGCVYDQLTKYCQGRI